MDAPHLRVFLNCSLIPAVPPAAPATAACSSTFNAATQPLPLDETAWVLPVHTDSGGSALCVDGSFTTARGAVAYADGFTLNCRMTRSLMAALRISASAAGWKGQSFGS